MEIKIKAEIQDLQLAQIIKDAEEGSIINVLNERHFELVKRLLVQFRRVGLRVCLLDEDGYITRQISSRMREEQIQTGFNDKQLATIKALEKVLAHCHREGVSLLGYSDELVAIPAHLVNSDTSSEQARDINHKGCYLGADRLKPKI